MIEVRTTPDFDKWFSKLKDQKAKQRIQIRIRRLSLGNPGDVKPVGEGVSELRKAKMTKTRVWDPVEHLDSEEAIVEYITAALEDGDAQLVAAALGDVARARGMTNIARETGLAREALYRSLSEEGNPSFDTIMRVTKALGVRLVAQADHAV